MLAYVADGEYADMIEGQDFGNEKCYEKALKLSRLHNRETVRQMRSQRVSNDLPQLRT